MGELKRVTEDSIADRRLREVAGISLPNAATGSMLDGLATLHSIVLAVDSRLRVIWLSDDLDIIPGGAEMTIGQSVSSLLDTLWPDDIAVFGDQTRQFFNAMIENGCVTRARFDLRWDGRALPLEVSGFHMQDVTGDDIVVCLADRHQTLESLERKNEELETYVRSVSHDLRSPLVSLLGFSRLLRDDYHDVLDENGSHFLDRIEEAGRNMERLLHDMLELSRIAETSHCRVQVSPTPILQQIRAELKLQLDERNIQLHVPDDPPTLHCDRTRLYQLLSNLIGNAIQHMDRATNGRIDVEIDSASDGWQIMVADNGPGIPTTDHDRIFEVFQTGEIPDGARKSSGLGLAIVKKIVESHSGRIWVESDPGSGARFFVWLPEG